METITVTSGENKRRQSFLILPQMFAFVCDAHIQCKVTKTATHDFAHHNRVSVSNESCSKVSHSVLVCQTHKHPEESVSTEDVYQLN